MMNLSFRSFLVYSSLAVFVFISSCNSGHSDLADKPLFSLLDKKQTHIDFQNQLEYTEEFNTYTYRNFYNGAGVGLGDFNNDGLTDIYFCGNMAGNKLYINKGKNGQAWLAQVPGQQVLVSLILMVMDGLIFTYANQVIRKAKIAIMNCSLIRVI
jgi:hypothetical protein